MHFNFNTFEKRFLYPKNTPLSGALVLIMVIFIQVYSVLIFIQPSDRCCIHKDF